MTIRSSFSNDDVIKWKHFRLCWPFVRGINRSSVNYPQKGQWRGALMFSLICAWINGWVNNGEVGELRRHHTHYNFTVMWQRLAEIGAWINNHNHNTIWNIFIQQCHNMKDGCPSADELTLMDMDKTTKPRKVRTVWIFLRMYYTCTSKGTFRNAQLTYPN